MRDNYDDPYESTAQWLQEAAGRRGRGPGLALPPLEPKPVGGSRRGRRILGIDRDLHLLAVAAALYLNYYFMQVTIEIDSMRSVLVFVPPLAG